MKDCRINQQNWANNKDK